jgi:MoxR-like ATPase
MIEREEMAAVSLTGSLGVRGWDHLDPVLLAALATEAPLLLVGPHGTAKSLLVERVATALELSLRHYNASLINYDDLVGIPLPDDDGQHLRFISTPGAIWEAEFVFFDEISRCRPDLQNKLFPIVHERRIAGIRLGKLQHRWAAMNPPAPEDLDGSNTGMEFYLGSEPLDPALTDRFPFVVPVPNWRQLTKENRRLLVTHHDVLPADDVSLHLYPLVEKVMETRARISALEAALSDWLVDYVVCVVDLLEQSALPQSPRRAHMLARSVVAVHAARQVIEGEDADLEQSCETALLFGMPQNATEVPPSRATVVASHKQAWEISRLMEGDSWRQVLEELDQVRRVVLADQLDLNDDDLSRLVTQALGSEQSDARRMGVATAVFLAFRNRRNLAPSAWEPVAQFASRLMEPRSTNTSIRPGTSLDTWQDINDWLNSQGDQTSMLNRLERNFVMAGFPDLWQRNDWKEALEDFRSDLILFGFEEANE